MVIRDLSNEINLILLSVIPLSGAYCIKRQRMRKIMRDMIDRDRKREGNLIIKITGNAVMHNL